VPWLQPSEQEKVHEKIDVGRQGFAGNGQTAGEFGCVEQSAVFVGEHRPKSAQGFRRDARTELGDVPFKVTA
jgi:hypothetical protein